MTARRRQILDAAVVAFYERGFKGVGVDELGSRAQLSGSALYRYFGSKAEILACLLDEALDELCRGIAAGPGPADALFDQALVQHVRFVQEHRELVTVYHRESDSLIEPWSTSFAQRRRTYTAAWEDLLANRFPALPADEIPAATQYCLGALYSIASWPRHVADAPTTPDLVRTVIASGLDARAGGG